MNWSPDIIHLHGWFTSLFPLYLKTYYLDEPIFEDSKIVVSFYPKDFYGVVSKKMYQKLIFDKIPEIEIDKLKEANYENLCYTTVKHADGFVFSDSAVEQSIYDFVADSKKPILVYDNIEQENAYVDFYKEQII